MGTKSEPGRYDCYSKAEPDEPLFVLLARDPIAPALVRQWAADQHSRGADPDKVFEALNVANDMDRWRKDYEARPQPPVIAAGDE